MYEIVVTTTPCSWCEKAKALLTEKNLPFRVSVLDTPEKLAAFRDAGFRKVPQVFHNAVLIGGYEDLAKSLAD